MAVSEALEILYHCPGERAPIGRAVHLARLVDGYAACRDCTQRDDTGHLTASQVSQIGRHRGRQQPAKLFDSEGLSGVCQNELHMDAARRLGIAVGAHLRHGAVVAGKAPTVIVGRDGRPVTAELLAAAGEGLRLAGCEVVEIGDVSAGCLAQAIVELAADAGLLVGNRRAQPHTASLTLWGRGAAAWSSPGELDAIAALWDAGVDRPVRHGGSLRRHAAAPSYLAGLEEFYYALRPLRFVVDTASPPLRTYLTRLLRDSACEILSPSPEVSANQKTVVAQTGTSAVQSASPAPVTANHLERRLAQLSRAVLSQQAHFGVWTDGDGEVCHVVDEHGQIVGPERLLLVLARESLDRDNGGTIVLESGTSAATGAIIARAGGKIARCQANRQALHEALGRHAAILGGGPSGRFSFGGGPLAADALRAVSLLLAILSHSDRGLSEVLDAAAVGE